MGIYGLTYSLFTQRGVSMKRVGISNDLKTTDSCCLHPQVVTPISDHRTGQHDPSTFVLVSQNALVH